MYVQKVHVVSRCNLRHSGPIFGDEIYWYCRIITNGTFTFHIEWLAKDYNMVGAETPTHFCWLYDMI